MMFTLQNRCFLRRVARLIAWLSMAEPGGLEHLPDEIHATDTAPRPHCAANRFLTASRCSKQGAWHGCSDPTPKRQPPLPDARG
jgi:hypothetical protein